jgi:hypothetical protein
VLADAVAPLERYFSALTRQVSHSVDKLRAVGGGEQDDWIAHAEPADVEAVCSLLEFALRQRAEGLQQFLFNALPSSFYSRGGLNRLLFGCDAILQEVCGLFDVVSPGFVVFGMPSQDGFSNRGPIVTAPIPALFTLEWWWVIYHEAAIYIHTHLFNTANLLWGAPDPERMNQKTFADIITLALPFAFDLELLTKMYAQHISVIQLSRAVKRVQSVTERIGMLALLSEVTREAGPPPVPADLPAYADAWIELLGERSWLAEPAMRKRVSEAARMFLETLRHVSSPRRADFLPQWVEIEESTRWGVKRRCDALDDFWTALLAERQRGSEDGPATAVHSLVQRLMGLAAREESAGGNGPSREPGSILLGDGGVSRLVHTALLRWAAGAPEEAGRQIVVPDFQERMTEYLSLWHTAVRSIENTEQVFLEG